MDDHIHLFKIYRHFCLLDEIFLLTISYIAGIKARMALLRLFVQHVIDCQ